MVELLLDCDVLAGVEVPLLNACVVFIGLDDDVFVHGVEVVNTVSLLFIVEVFVGTEEVVVVVKGAVSLLVIDVRIQNSFDPWPIVGEASVRVGLTRSTAIEMVCRDTYLLPIMTSPIENSETTIVCQ